MISLQRYRGEGVVNFRSTYEYKLFLVDRWWGIDKLYGVLIDTRTPASLRKEMINNLRDHQISKHTQLAMITPSISNITSKLTSFYVSLDTVRSTADYADILSAVVTVVGQDYVPAISPMSMIDPYEWLDFYECTYYIKSNGQHGIMDPADGDITDLFRRLTSLNL